MAVSEVRLWNGETCLGKLASAVEGRHQVCQKMAQSVYSMQIAIVEIHFSGNGPIRLAKNQAHASQ
jgi:hypothetical protein